MKRIIQDEKQEAQPKVTIEELFDESKAQHELDQYIADQLKNTKDQKVFDDKQKDKAKAFENKKITKHNMKFLSKLQVGAPCCSRLNTKQEPLSKKQLQKRLTSDDPKLLKDLAWIGHIKSFAYDDEGTLNVLVTTVKFSKGRFDHSTRRDKVVHPEDIYIF